MLDYIIHIIDDLKFDYFFNYVIFEDETLNTLISFLLCIP
jgi:hypothetical protein